MNIMPRGFIQTRLSILLVLVFVLLSLQTVLADPPFCPPPIPCVSSDQFADDMSAIVSEYETHMMRLDTDETGYHSELANQIEEQQKAMDETASDRADSQHDKWLATADLLDDATLQAKNKLTDLGKEKTNAHDTLRRDTERALEQAARGAKDAVRASESAARDTIKAGLEHAYKTLESAERVYHGVTHMQEQRVQTDAEERSRRIRQRIINAIELLRQQFDDAQHRIQEKEDFVQRRLQLLQADGVKSHNLNMLTVERAEREMRKRIAAAAFAAGKDQVSRIYEVGAQDASPFGVVGLAAAERLAVRDAGRRAAFEVDTVANSVNMRQTNAINAAHMTSERLFHASK